MSRARHWIILLALGVPVGFVAGLGMFTFLYAGGTAYLTDEPKACMNCHVMSDQYGGWIRSSHRAVATCNDCHAPHSFLAKYVTKAKNGFFHSLAFTTGRFPDPIRIGEANRKITEAACLHCHRPLVELVFSHGNGQLSCIQCHRHVGHKN
jgi:cytochrome c nitrite reductase small subunit